MPRRGPRSGSPVSSPRGGSRPSARWARATGARSAWRRHGRGVCPRRARGGSDPAVCARGPTANAAIRAAVTARTRTAATGRFLSREERASRAPDPAFFAPPRAGVGAVVGALSRNHRVRSRAASPASPRPSRPAARVETARECAPFAAAGRVGGRAGGSGCCAQFAPGSRVLRGGASPPKAPPPQRSSDLPPCASHPPLIAVRQPRRGRAVLPPCERGISGRAWRVRVPGDALDDLVARAIR